MTILKSIIGLVFLVGTLIFSGCNQSNESDTATDYTDTVESAAPLQDNNTRNDQPTDELTKKDSLNRDTLKSD